MADDRAAKWRAAREQKKNFSEVNNSQRVLLTLDEAKIELLRGVGEKLVALARSRAPGSEGSKQKHINYKIIGKSTVQLEVTGPLRHHEYGTGIAGEAGHASGRPYDIPKDRHDNYAFKPQQEYTIITGYKYFRTKGGKVKSIAVKEKVRLDKGRRPGLKALKIPLKGGGHIFRHNIKDHPGVPARRFIRDSIAEIRDHYWEEIAQRVFSRVARQRGVAYES